MLDIYLDGDISKDDYNTKKNELENQIAKLQIMSEQKPEASIDSIDIDEVRNCLNELLKLENEKVPDNIIEKFVSKIITTQDGTFIWFISIGKDKFAKVPCTISGRKNKAILNIGETECLDDSESCHRTYFLSAIYSDHFDLEIKKIVGSCLRYRLQSTKRSNLQLLIFWRFCFGFKRC